MDLLTPVNTAAALFGAVAAAHLACLVHDSLAEPRFLKPADKPLVNRMKKTKPILAPQGASYWQAVQGAQASHILGLTMFVFLIELASSPLMAWLRPAILLAAVLYTLISWRSWFWMPTTAMAVATGLLAVAWIA